MESTYTPVPYEWREVIAELIGKEASGKVFFFDRNNAVECVEGKLKSLNEIPGQGLFILLEPEYQVRIDRIITLFGKPGAAYDEYDAFANQCLSCTAGYPIE